MPLSSPRPVQVAVAAADGYARRRAGNLKAGRERVGERSGCARNLRRNDFRRRQASSRRRGSGRGNNHSRR